MKRKNLLLLAGILLCITFLYAASIYANDDSRMSVRSGAVSIEQKSSQPLKSVSLDNINLNQESIDLSTLIKGRSPSQIQSTSKIQSKNVSHSGVSLRSNASPASRPSKEKPTNHWIKGKISKPASSDLSVTANQSKELQKLEKHREDRKSSFKKSLEANSNTRNSRLLKPIINNTSEKDNE